MSVEYRLARLLEEAIAQREAEQAHCALVDPDQLAGRLDLTTGDVLRELARAYDAGLISVTAVEIARPREGR